MPEEMRRGTSSMSWWMADPFPRSLGYFTSEPEVTPALAETKTGRPLRSTLWISSRWGRNSLGSGVMWARGGMAPELPPCCGVAWLHRRVPPADEKWGRESWRLGWAVPHSPAAAWRRHWW